MRIRRAVATAVVGAALLTGGTTAVAQAAASGPVGVFEVVRVGTYGSRAACVADGQGSAHAVWWCERNGSRWELWVDTDT